ncbi:MAG TPA: secretin N-terminal domain-containing protein, partial [Xanthomonadales bacterium]|nr:secretin N-terminal domain-containing protein [Xanthomonadales bacterium]
MRRLLAAAVALVVACAALAQPGEHTLNLKDADIRVLIATVSEITGRNFIVDPRVEGKVNVVSARPMTADEVYDVFESVLRVHGYAALPSGSMVKIVPEAIANQDGGVLVPESAGPDTMVTKLIPLRHVSANELIAILRPLVPQQGHIVAHQGSNALLISDRAGNVARLEQLIQRIDQGTDAAVEVIPLNHASAAELARTLTLLADDKSAQLTGVTPAKVFADARTNSILLSGDRATRLRMRSMIAHLDTPLETSESTNVIYLHYAKAEDMVPILESTAQ